MAKVEIYFKDYCPYCHKALDLLKSKNIEFKAYDITHDEDGQAEMKRRNPGARTVPQIFIDDTPIGGCDDLFALDKSGKLEAMLGNQKNSNTPKPK